MKLRCVLSIVLIAFCSALTAQQSKPSSLPRPKLVVGLVIDQMRWDYLYKFYDRYGSTGFKRLLNEGFSCENTQISYIPAHTACGHASLYTGSVPSVHGIAGNYWIDQATGKRTDAVIDTTVSSIGTTSDEGKMSPRNLLTTTITDELKLATNFRSKVIGIALKDRGAVFPVGHTADAAYWYDDINDRWVTSSFYRANLPEWVEKFNKGMTAKYFDKKWETLYPIDTYKQSSIDNSPRYEAKLGNESAPIFPHRLTTGKAGDSSTVKFFPFGNGLTFDFAKAAIESESLGKSAITDFLSISISPTDVIGHQFGPSAIEIEDTYLRLDKDIAEFLVYLDKTIGKGQYSLFLSADHGAPHNPNFLGDHKMPTGIWEGVNSNKGAIKLNSILAKKYGQNKIIRTFFNYQVHFNYPVIEENGLNLDEIKKDVKRYFRSQSGVQYVVDMENIGNEPIPEVVKSKIINGYNRKRSGEIQIVLSPGVNVERTNNITTGTTHGTWNAYDSHIPLIFFGWGFKQGKTNRTIDICDVAPTISALLHIQEPNGNVGQPITEVLK